MATVQVHCRTCRQYYTGAMQTGLAEDEAEGLLWYHAAYPISGYQLHSLCSFCNIVRALAPARRTRVLASDLPTS